MNGEKSKQVELARVRVAEHEDGHEPFSLDHKGLVRAEVERLAKAHPELGLTAEVRCGPRNRYGSVWRRYTLKVRTARHSFGDTFTADDAQSVAMALLQLLGTVEERVKALDAQRAAEQVAREQRRVEEEQKRAEVMAQRQAAAEKLLAEAGLDPKTAFFSLGYLRFRLDKSFGRWELESASNIAEERNLRLPLTLGVESLKSLVASGLKPHTQPFTTDLIVTEMGTFDFATGRGAWSTEYLATDEADAMAAAKRKLLHEVNATRDGGWLTESKAPITGLPTFVLDYVYNGKPFRQTVTVERVKLMDGDGNKGRCLVVGYTRTNEEVTP